ncbi:hemolysin family protein [Woodsholea maritima]|uniref:hemolysin family protein n=1 Tax=Woodsholea maritima TaxID=240237 RepID=UPI000362AC89|nr:hemolysin family protein [Woodsholea maritima]
MSDPASEPPSLFARMFGVFKPSSTTGDANEIAVKSANGDLLLNAQSYEHLRVADVMVPRADIIAVEIDTPLAELFKVFSNAAHSRLPIYDETLDDPLGVAHIKDVVAYLSGDEDGKRPDDWRDQKILADIRRPLLYVPPSMRALDLLLKMQTRRMHMALVVDEFGGTDGLVTLEDLIEPIVGNIEDEHDEDEAPSIRAKTPACWEADARASIEDFEALVGETIANGEEESDVDTLGGLVYVHTGRIPERGEVVHHDSGYEFEILDSDPRRIKKLRIKRVGHAPQQDAAVDAA